MATVDAAVLQPVRRVLNDLDEDRWGEEDLVQWLNFGIRLFIDLKPSIVAQETGVSLVAGVAQTFPARFAHLIKFTHMDASGLAVTPVDERSLSAEAPGWRAAAAATDVVHYIVDEDDQSGFSVYPPQPNGTSEVLVGKVAEYPADLAGGNDTFPLDDQYVALAVDYVIYRALLRDADDPSTAQRAETHFVKSLEPLVGRREAERLYVQEQEAGA